MTTAVDALHQAVTAGKCRLLAELGQGGMAIVYLAVTQGPGGFNKLVVLKTLKPALREDADLKRMFSQEARLAARLNHPCIVQTYEVFGDGGIPVIVMEYLDGQALGRILQRTEGTFSQAMHVRVIADLSSALHYAHELTDYDGTPLGLVHRDVSPHNVMVTYDGQTKLLDFGIAKLTRARPETETGVIKGKLRYMAPEQIEGEPLDRRADIFALGVMLWEAAAGEELWRGNTEPEIMHRVLNSYIPSPRSVRPDISAEFERICMKALAAAREDRYPTAAELELELEGLLETLGGRVNHRLIGRTVSSLFADKRATTQGVIDEQLGRVASLTREEYETADSSLVSLPKGDDATTVHPRLRPSRAAWLKRIGWAGLGALVLAETALLVTQRAERASPLAPAASSPTAPSQGSVPVPTGSARERVRVELGASPPEARLSLDGERLPDNPSVHLLLREARGHVLTAEAPGYEKATAAFIADRPSTVKLELERPRPRDPAGRRSPPAGAHEPAPKPTAPDCDPPYVVDREGTKRFKMECL